ncbi:MAG: hypothetical protein J6I73_04895 [Treponema sp.]|nr:hypothetical protein [Treponema sp.]
MDGVRRKTLKVSIILFCTVIVFFLFVGCRSVRDKNVFLTQLISISYNGETKSISEQQNYFLPSEKFDLYFEKEVQKTGICIFSYYSSDYQAKYKLPVKADDTVIFCSGCAMAEPSVDTEKGYTLIVNNEYSFSYIFGNKKIDTENGFILPVRYIADVTGKFNGGLYISFWADFNNNKIIEENEYAILTLHFPLNSYYGLDFSTNKRAYFSSMGYSLRKDTAVYKGSEFKVYKINSNNDFVKICQIENKNLINKTLENIFLQRFEDKNLVGRKTYLCFIPKGYNQIGNTFRIRGSDAVYIEVEKDKPENDRSVNIRNFDISDNEPEPKIRFYYDGKLIETSVIEF